MESRGRNVSLVLAAIAIGTPALAVALDAAGEGVALVLAIAALVLLVLSYALLAARVFRLHGDERAEEKARAAGRLHMPVMIGAPFVVRS